MLDIPRTAKPKRPIGVIPLIDVAMFLLIFFMVAGSIEKAEIIPISPPKASNSVLVDEGHIIILLGKHDEVIIQDELLAIDDIKPKLSAQLRLNPDKVVTVKADASIPANRMLAVMEALKAAGAKNLSIATERKYGK